MLGAYCWLLWLMLAGGWATFPQFPLDWFKVLAGVAHSQANMAPTLAPEPLEGAGVLPVGGAFSRPLGVLSMASSRGGPCAMADRCAADQGSLSQTMSAIMGARVARSAPVHLSPPMASLSVAIWGAGRAVALSCSGQGSHQFGNLVPQFCSALFRQT